MSKRIDLAVPFVEKEEAKQFFVEWDEVQRVWWTTEEFMCEGLERWLPFQPTPEEVLAVLPPFSSTETERQHVELLAQTCEYPEWLLLMLPGGLWGAFLRADLDSRAASAVVEGDYAQGCCYVSRTPADTLAFMREHRVYQGVLRGEDDHWSQGDNRQDDLDEAQPWHCTGQLTIGQHTIEVQLPLSCANLIAHLSADTPVLEKDSPLSLAVFAHLDRFTPSSVKSPLNKQLDLAYEISQKLRIPLSVEQRENRAACMAFIEQHKTDLTLYRVIFTEIDRGSWPLAKRINNYVKWSTAKTLLDTGVPWESIAEALGVKTRATVEKYAAKATEAENETPELLTIPLYQDLIRLGRGGRSVDLALREMAETQAWEVFSRERRIRSVLRRQSSAAS
ncbi:hypothetical protein PS865_02602 [Pseudomonas fluorescens]|uniref:DUF5710 domain-containing protein n=1 Tax=Pseudomonas fluorescens TaxID=294 RepID=UPI0012422F55|nr:DUF5710 domain-containing protein [Pseudomonas fluorescens]VVO96170.1 hypothetical protein PS865_02602 [Pseudomonas fluorescens]